jgi:ABC-type transport system substrate-binding protein
MKKWSIIAAIVMVALLVLVACEPEEVIKEVIKEVIVTQVVEKEVVVTEIVEIEGEQVEVTRIVKEEVIVEVEVEVTVEPEEEVEAEGEITSYMIALFEDPVSLNYWNFLGPGSSVWTSYVLSGSSAGLYTLSDQRFDFVPSLAVDFPEIVQDGDVWKITVQMVENATWSDGEPITTRDVVFTHNACKDLKLTQNWPNQCEPTGVAVAAEALDDYTVQYAFAEEPSLGTWQAGVALAPILPQHFWADAVAESYSYLEGLEEPAEDDDCTVEEPSDVCVAYNEAYVNARRTLYEADATGVPSAGGYVTDKLELGAFAQRTLNDAYFFAGAEVVEYDDGTWILELPDGTVWQAYGDATGDETLRFTSGPYAPNIIFSIYGSQDSAFLALADGEVDYVLNPLGLARGLKEQAMKGENIKVYTNADYGMFYVAFNLRKYPMSDYAFRQAIDIVLDKEFVVNNVLAGVVFPMYSTMPPGNGFWHNPDVPTPYVGMSRDERVQLAVQVLKDAGWSWSQEPAYSEDIEDVVPGEGITMPNGEPMPEITILGPGPAYDPLRATFNQWISEWARELGMPVESELTGFNTILDPVFIDSDFDMYILGWSLGNVAFPDYFESFWHSRNDTAVSGNYNTPGLNNPEYDALVDEFMTTGDLARAQELVFEMQVMLADLRPYIPLFYKTVTDLARGNIQFPYTEVLGGLVDADGFQTDAIPLSQ